VSPSRLALLAFALVAFATTAPAIAALPAAERDEEIVETCDQTFWEEEEYSAEEQALLTKACGDYDKAFTKAVNQAAREEVAVLRGVARAKDACERARPGRSKDAKCRQAARRAAAAPKAIARIVKTRDHKLEKAADAWFDTLDAHDFFGSDDFEDEEFDEGDDVFEDEELDER
jgi:hypothetical protein